MRAAAEQGDEADEAWSTSELRSLTPVLGIPRGLEKVRTPVASLLTMALLRPAQPGHRLPRTGCPLTYGRLCPSQLVSSSSHWSPAGREASLGVHFTAGRSLAAWWSRIARRNGSFCQRSIGVSLRATDPWPCASSLGMASQLRPEAQLWTSSSVSSAFRCRLS